MNVMPVMSYTTSYTKTEEMSSRVGNFNRATAFVILSSRRLRRVSLTPSASEILRR